MVRGPQRSSDALVLRVVDYGDADRIVTLLTREEGLLSAMARGARKSRKRFAGALSPGCLVRVEYRQGRGDLAHLERAEVLDPFERTLTDLRRIALSGAVVELLREICPERAPDFGTFDAALEALSRIARETPREELLLAFHVHLLSRAGLAPVLDVCVATGQEAPEGRAAYFDPARGGVVARAGGGGPLVLSWAARRGLLEARESGSPGLEPWGPEARVEARRALAAFTEVHLSRRLRSAGFVAQLFDPPAEVP